MRPIIIDTPQGKEIIIRENIDVITLAENLPEAFNKIMPDLFSMKENYILMDESKQYIKTYSENNKYSCIIELGSCLAWLGENKETNLYFYSIVNKLNPQPHSWNKIGDPFSHFNTLGHFDNNKGDQLFLLSIDTSMKGLERASSYVIELRETASGKLIYVPL